MAKADRLTSQLVHVADIVGDLGLNIARAQKEMNANYIKTIQVLMKMAADTLGKKPGSEEQEATMISFIKSFAPTRYQYTETVLDFSADLAETKQFATQAGVSVSFKAIAVNASMTLGYGHDYRASARITTSIHAYQDPNMADQFLARAKDISDNNQKLPDPTDIDKEIYDGVNTVWKALTEKKT